MKNNTALWVVGGILVVVIIIAAAYALTRKPTPQQVAQPVQQPGILGLLSGLFGKKQLSQQDQAALINAEIAQSVIW